MKNHLYIRGGCRIGWINSAWPFASLEVTSENLCVRAFLRGKFDFATDDVLEIQAFTIIPFLAWGIKIVHKNNSVPKDFIFWTLSSPTKLVQAIQALGYLPKGDWNKHQ